jgi:diamine N-acetyltransferase
MKIRKAKKSDIPKIKPYLLEMWIEHARNVPTLLDEDRMKNSDIDAYYGECFKLENTNKYIVLVAQEGREFAGFIKADLQEIANFFKDNLIYYIDDIYVVPKYRRHSVAKKLVNELEKIAKRQGIKRIQGRIYSFNKVSQQCFSKLGYSMPHSTWDKLI